MTTATVSENGVLLIPESVREEAKLAPGTKVALHVQGSNIVIMPVEADHDAWMELYGMICEGPSLTAALEEERRWEIEHDRR